MIEVNHSATLIIAVCTPFQGGLAADYSFVCMGLNFLPTEPDLQKQRSARNWQTVALVLSR
jgi:hypothetical protein